MDLDRCIDKSQYVGQDGAMTVSMATEKNTHATSCCVMSAEGVIDDAAVQQLARVFKALGDPARVKLLSLIIASASGEMCICDLTEPVGLSQPTVSHHMKLLTEAGLVSREQRGRWAYYRPNTEVLTEATRSLIA